jgi:hypothetical protein
MHNGEREHRSKQRVVRLHELAAPGHIGVIAQECGPPLTRARVEPLACTSGLSACPRESQALAAQDPPESIPMPSQDRFRLDDGYHTLPSRQRGRAHHEPEPVEWHPPRPRHLTAQFHDRMPEQRVLPHQVTPGPYRIQGNADHYPIGNRAKLRPQPRTNRRKHLANRVQESNIRVLQQLFIGPAKSGPRVSSPFGRSDGPGSQYGRAQPPRPGQRHPLPLPRFGLARRPHRSTRKARWLALLLRAKRRVNPARSRIGTQRGSLRGACGRQYVADGYRAFR